jgi:hypothetical protein
MIRFAFVIAIASVCAQVHAQTGAIRDIEWRDLDGATGVAHFSQCSADTCMLWVKLPTLLTKARLVCDNEAKEELFAPLAVVDFSQAQAEFAPSRVRTFLSGGLKGFRVDISRSLAKTCTLSATVDDGTLVYELKDIQAWLND